MALILPACGGGGGGGTPGGGTVGTPPLGFSLRSPNDGEQLALTRPQFGWDVALGAFSYRIEISTASNFSSVVEDQSVTATTWAPSLALAGSTTHYWRVRAVDYQGETFATNGPFSFKTVSTANSW